MVQIKIAYEGALRCTATHGPSGTQLVTDPPVDNCGRGESFSPTDLVATALGTCMLTLMGIVAERHGWDIAGSTLSVEKVMQTEPQRRIGRLVVRVRMTGALDARARRALERAALTCPVAQTLGERVEIPITWEWESAPVA